MTQGTIGKKRNFIAVIIFSIITLGIYWLVYVFKTHSEIKNATGKGMNPGVALLLAIIVGFVTPFILGSDVKKARESRGMEGKVSALTAFWILIPLLGFFIYLAKVQGALNDLWS